jgi:LPS-assembly protein
MKRIAFLSVFFLLAISAKVFAQEKIMPVEINGDEISYLQEQGKVVVKGHVRMKYQEVDLSCDQANYDSNTHVAHVTGNVKIVRQNVTVYGEDINYDFNTQNIQIIKLRMESPPFYANAKTANRQGLDRYNLNDGHTTTCELEKPHYRFLAKQITIYPKERIVAKNVVMKVGEVPIFYFPYLSIPIKDKFFPVEIVPGKKSDWGYYMLGRWRYRYSAEQKGKVIFDWYEKRGWGTGVTHKMDNKKYGEALANFYYIDDQLYKPSKRGDLFAKYPERQNMDPNLLNEDRYKAQLFYEVKPIQNLNIKSEFNKFSDENFMKDFFNREYDIEPHPLSYALFDYGFSNSALTMLTQGRANKFFSETEYLPQLQYDLFKQNLGQSGLYLESKNTFGYLDYKNANVSGGQGSARVYNHNIFSYPKSIKWLQINPYVGDYVTFYSKNVTSQNDIWRVAPEFGIDFSTKLSQVYGVDHTLFGTKIEKVRHIITPRVSYHYIRPPSISKNSLIQFDDIDSLSKTGLFVIALDNKLQARNEKKVWDFVFFSPSLEFQVDKKERLGRLDKDGTYLSAIKTDLEIYPVEGIALKSDTEYDYALQVFKSANVDLNFRDLKNNKYSVALGHRYVREYDYNSDSGDYSSQTTLDYSYQLTSKLQFRNYLRYEYKDGNFEQQQYSLRTDLHCWWMDVGVNIDKQRDGVTDTTLWLSFTLKAFPEAHIGFDQTYSGAKSSY